MSAKAILQSSTRIACSDHLDEFLTQTPGIMLAQLTTADGFEVAAAMRDPKKSSTAKLAAMSSSLHALCEAMVIESGLETSRNLIIESDDGHIVMMSIPKIKPAMSLMVVSDRSAILGHLLWATKKSTQTFSQLIES